MCWICHKNFVLCSMRKFMKSPFTGNKILDITNKKWNKLTAIKPVEKPKHLKALKQFWLFRCDCGNEKILDPNDVSKKERNIKSCGCLKQIKNKKTKPKFFEETSLDDISDNYIKHLKENSEKSKNRKTRNITFNLTKKQLWEVWERQKGICPYTKEKLLVCFNTTTHYKSITASLDRVDSSKNYTIDNIEWVHKTVNKMKNNLTRKEFIKFCILISKNNNYE